MNRRTWNLALLGTAAPLLAGGLAACSSNAPPLRWYRLPTELPADEALPPRAAAPTAALWTRATGAAPPVWELAAALRLPELLERDTLQVEEGVAGVRLLYGHRWAEPLRDALPRLLRHDLALWLPGLWPAPAPPEVLLAGRVQIELLALQGSLPRREVLAAARAVVTPVAGGTAGTARMALANEPIARAFRIEERVAWADASAESLVVAQRVAMWRLARRIAAQITAG